MEIEKNIPYGELLKENEKIEILKNSNIVKFNKKEVIFRQGTRTSHFMYVKSGLVKIYKEGKNNRGIIIKIAKPGEYIGMISIFGSDTYQFSGASITNCEIGIIDHDIFMFVFKNNGNFAQKIVENISKTGLFLFEKLLSYTHKQLPGRIADVILYFAEDIYNNEEFEFPLTRKELAELAGTTKESFIRTLTEFKNDKIIELNGSKVKINSMKIIKVLSELG